MSGSTQKPVPGVVRLREMLADPKNTGEYSEGYLIL